MNKLQTLSDYLVARSYPNYNENCGRCAKAVREAIEYAFNPKTLRRTLSAKNYGSSLEEFGFRKVDNQNYIPQIGDVAIIHYEPHGHICAYCNSIFPKTGKNFKGWVSDFQQIDVYGGKIRKSKPKIIYYRFFS